MSATVAAPAGELSAKDIRLVIGASSLGTVFEWYDFFIYGTLAAIIGRTFFPTGDPTVELLLSLAGFAIGFGFRPLGAVLFGYLGDKLGRKYTFLVTITLMGLATAAIGFVPSEASIGFAAPVIIIFLRVLQGLALGGEYGGAAIYVSEHAPPGKRGFYTSFIQASVAGGFILSLAVVLGTRAIVGEEAWQAWGWRLPFVFSLLLLAISLWMRLKLSESPVFAAMKAAGTTSANPLKESFTYPGNKKRILVALFGVAAGLTVIWYTAMFGALFFLTGPMKVDPRTAEMLVGIGAASGLIWFVLFGWLSDKAGRKWPIVIGYGLTLVLLFPLFKLMGFAAADAANLNIPLILLAVLGLSALSGMTYGPVAALLTEMFPARIRYSSMSIPYHIGTGYFGGFLPLISQSLVARTGDAYAGLWYTWGVVLLALIVSLWGLPNTDPQLDMDAG